MIHEFFVVTMTSVYHVMDREAARASNPMAEKIFAIGKSRVPVGARFEQGPLIGITRRMVSFTPEGTGFLAPMSTYERDPTKVNTRWWHGSTSPIVALFTNLDEALKCLSSEDLKPCDARWIESTRHVIAEIGDDHPDFSVVRGEYALIPAA